MFRLLDFLDSVPPLSAPPIIASHDVGDLIAAAATAAAVSASWSDFVLIIPDDELGLSIYIIIKTISELENLKKNNIVFFMKQKETVKNHLHFYDRKNKPKEEENGTDRKSRGLCFPSAL